MSVFALIVCIYIALNLAMLVFRPVRKAWREFFTESWPELLKGIIDLWSDLGYEFKQNWWQMVICLPLYPLGSLLLLLLLLVMTVVPYIQYSRAIEDVKRAKYEKSEEYQQYKQREQQYELWCDTAKNTEVVFHRDMPFCPGPWDVIYVEDKHNPTVNDYITEHYDDICRIFSESRWVFNYLPKISNQPVASESLRYMFPYYKQDSVPVGESVCMEELTRHIVEGKVSGPSLIRLLPSRRGKVSPFLRFHCLQLDVDSSFTLSEQICWYLRKIGKYYYDDGVRYMLVPPEGDEVADWCFNDGDADSYSEYSQCIDMKPEESRIVKEIRDRVNELRKRGFQLGLLHKLIEEQPTLSRLVVDKDFKILLPDYNNIEIEMQPLPKAVYLLFLRHPDGIVFKQLSDYYEELLDIYMQVGNRVIESNIQKSIRDIADPTKNSINEKCTRIREAFLAKFDYVYARHYFITGKRGEPRKIDLPLHLIELQCF